MRHFILHLFIIVCISPCLVEAGSKKPKKVYDTVIPDFLKLVFLIPEKAKGQLISIEFENPDCKTLKWKKGVLKFKIPENGKFCVSNDIRTIGFPDEEFYTVTPQGKRKSAKIREQIFHPEIRVLNENERKFPVFRFFYGTKELAMKQDISY